MAEIAIISQDFCSLQELQSQRENNKIDYKSISPWVQAQYSLGPYSVNMPSYSYSYGFMRKVSENETRVGNLKITKNSDFTRGVSVSYSSAYLDMDNNRVINLGDADMGGPSIGQLQVVNRGTPHHAVNLRVGDQRYLSKQSWAPDIDRTMEADLIFSANSLIRRNINNGILTITGASGERQRAQLILDALAPHITLQTQGGLITVIGNELNQNITTSVETISQTFQIGASNFIELNTPEVNVTGDITMNAGYMILGGPTPPVNNQKRIKNLRSYTYEETGRGKTQFDRDAISFGDFKALQRGENLGSATHPNGVGNVYIGQDQGVHQFRRIRGGTNIRVDQIGNDIVINNTASLAVTLDAHGLSQAQVVQKLTSLFPPGGFGDGTVLNVILDRPSVTPVGALKIDVSDNRTVVTQSSIGRGIVSVGLTGSITATGSVPAASQPKYQNTQTFQSYVKQTNAWIKTAGPDV